jgi:predicted alpha-1,2-mannosidase
MTRMGESAQVSVAVGSGPVQTSFDSRGLKFSHDDEVSSPQLYSVKLQTAQSNYNITAEMTATSRVGRLRFTFDSPDSNFAVVQATRKLINGEIYVDAVNREIYGYNPERQDAVLGPFKAEDFKGYFVAQFDADFESYGIALGDVQTAMATAGKGEELSAYVTFKTPTSKTVNVRVGVSYISYAQARQNIANEAPSSATFENTVTAVEQLWASKLDLITLHNASDADASIFYTSMFHALQYPNEMFETNATGSFYYSGFDNAVHAGEAYTGYSIWDTFRAEWSFLNMFAPERINSMITSMLQTFQQGGRLPIWQNIVETNIMIGTHSNSLIAESLAKGFKGFDLGVAWEALLKDAEVPPDDDLTTVYFDREPGTACEARAGLTREKELGYVAAILTSEAGSRTLEYAYNDYSVGKFAELTGRTEEAAKYYGRSKWYANIWNPETMMMEARYENGTWCSASSTWTEATDWVYTFNVFHDFPGLRDLFQGPEALGAKLDAYYAGGHNDQTNEPSHATVFAYMYANMPWKAQSKIRELMRDNYFSNPIGLSGNEGASR